MPVEMSVDSLDTVEESLRGAYVEVEGKFNLDPDKYAEVKIQSSGLKKKNSDLIAANKQAKESLKRFEKFAELEDDDLNELWELREAKNNPPPADPKQPPKGNEELQATYEKARKKDRDQWNVEKTALETERDALRKENKHFKLTVPLRQIALDAGVLPEYLELALLETHKRFELNDDDKIVVLDEDGDPTDIKPDSFFNDLYKVQRAAFYKPSGAGGSGAPSQIGSGGGRRAMRRSDWKNLPAGQQQAFMKDVREGKASLVD